MYNNSQLCELHVITDPQYHCTKPGPRCHCTKPSGLWDWSSWQVPSKRRVHLAMTSTTSSSCVTLKSLAIQSNRYINYSRSLEHTSAIHILLELKLLFSVGRNASSHIQKSGKQLSFHIVNRSASTEHIPPHCVQRSNTTDCGTH